MPLKYHISAPLYLVKNKDRYHSLKFRQSSLLYLFIVEKISSRVHRTKGGVGVGGVGVHISVKNKTQNKKIIKHNI